MNSIRKLPISIIPMVLMLAGCSFLFFAFAQITRSTANILAWGFNGIPHLEKSNFALFIYEFGFVTHAYPSLLLGLLLVGLAAIILFLRGTINEHRTSKIFWIIWAIGTVSFIVSNLTLMLLPDPSHLPKYLGMMFTNPDPGGRLYNLYISPYQYWCYILPALVSILFFTINSFSISSRIQAIIQTLPLCFVPFVFAYYHCYTYLSSGSPIYYSKFLNILTPFLILVPVIGFVYFTRKFHSKSYAN